MIVGSTDGTDLPTVKTPGPKCFRISGVPQDWSEVELIDALRATDWFINDNSYQLSIYPACYGFTQTALLNLDTCPEYFRRLKASKSYYKPVSTDSKAEVILTLDSHFHDLTPLNYTPESDIIAESVRNPDHKNILNSTHEIFFFGTPH